MRPQEARPVKTDCTFTAEDMAELAKAHQLVAIAKGYKSKAERAGAMQGITQHQQGLLVRWLTCRMRGRLKIQR